MNAAAASFFWARFRRPHTYSAADSIKTASFGLNSGGLSPMMNAAAATLFWSQFGWPQPGYECSSSQLLLGSIPAASYLRRGGQPQNSIFWSQFGRRGFSLAMNAAAATLF
jgi:hypothetical protein